MPKDGKLDLAFENPVEMESLKLVGDIEELALIILALIDEIPFDNEEEEILELKLDVDGRFSQKLLSTLLAFLVKLVVFFLNPLINPLELNLGAVNGTSA